MTNKFLCGRLIINKDGTKKRLVLAEGGGGRDCIISHIDIGFDEIHDRLREIFALGIDHTNRPSKLYDFQKNELDRNRYTTFYDYVQKNGLNFKSILLYLGTSADDEDNFSLPSPKKRNITITTQPVRISIPAKRNVSRAEADSSTPPIVIKADEDDIQRINNDPVLNHRILENLRISSFSNYSFENSLVEFIDYLRNLISQYNRETVLIQLFEHICTIRGLASIILDRLKQERQSGNEGQKSIYDDGLEKIEKLCRSIKALIELNKMKISHIDQHSIINSSFNQFQQNFNILRDEWNNKKTSHRPGTSYSSTSHSVDLPSSRYHSETNSRKRSRVSSQSPRHHHTSSTRSPRRRRSSSRSPRRRHSSPTRSPRRQHVSSSSSHHRSTTNNKPGINSSFEKLLNSLDYFSKVLRRLNFNSFGFSIENFIGRIQNCRSNLDSSDYRSLCNAEGLITKIEIDLTNRMNDEHNNAKPHKVHEDLQRSFDETLDLLGVLLNALHDYQTKRSRTTHHRSSPVERKPNIHKTDQPKSTTNNYGDDDDQSSEASHSSIGDEQLMEVARNAYEQRPNLSK